MSSELEETTSPWQPSAAQDYPNHDPVLLERLRQWRREEALKHDIPAFWVMSNRTLYALADKNPTTYAELVGVYGLGRARLERYANDLMGVLDQHRVEKKRAEGRKVWAPQELYLGMLRGLEDRIGAPGDGVHIELAQGDLGILQTMVAVTIMHTEASLKEKNIDTSITSIPPF